MLPREDELEAFKTRINLSEYAASAGYAIDRKASSRNSAVMKDGKGDKIVIAKGNDRHWVYFSVGNEKDSGSIIDFVQGRGGGSLGDVRKTLRPWLSETGPATRPAAQSYAPLLEPITRDMARVRARFEAAQDAPAHPYLLAERRIPPHVLGSERFAGRVRIDERGNAIFPHFGREGLCGFEIKNRGFTGFAPGGEKGLWCSRTREGDTALVIAETAIDALSYAALKPDPPARYVSTAGEFNPVQPGLLKAAAEKLPAGGRVIIATDNDAGGDQLSEKLQALLGELSASGRVLIIDRPQGRGEDWNDVLRASTAQELRPVREP